MLLYIHIPFCDSKCHYCAFNSYVDKFDLQSAYMDALLKQLRFELRRFALQKNSLKTLFIGGGTPSCVDAALYRPIFETLAPFLRSDAEITAEANPNSATQAWLQTMYDFGVNRISFGVQSFDANKLKLLNRAHSPRQAKLAIERAKKIGFFHLSIDLIYGVAGDTDALLQKDLQNAFALPIDHLSAYALTIEPRTKFAKTPSIANESLQQTKRLFEAIEKHGFTQYEISNFGRYKSRHNLGYWRYEDYIGIGAGAVGKYQTKRFYPQSAIEQYVNDPFAIREERLSQEDVTLEKIFLGLRSIVGIERRILGESRLQKAFMLCEEEKLIYKNDRFYNTDFLLADEIALFLD